MTSRQYGVRVFVVIVATVATVGMIGGCSTVEGLGRDTSDLARWTGERIDNGFKRPQQ